MGIRSKIRDHLVARLAATQKELITGILSTRQSLRQVHTRRLELHNAIVPMRAGDDGDDSISNYEGHLRSYSNLARRLQADLERLEKKLAESEVALDRLVGPLHVELRPGGEGTTGERLEEEWKELLGWVHWGGVAMVAVMLFAVVFATLGNMAWGPQSRVVRWRVPEGGGNRGASEPLWEQVAPGKYKSHFIGSHDPRYGAATGRKVDDFQTAPNAKAGLWGAPTQKNDKMFDTIQKQAELQEETFRRYEAAARTAEGKTSPPTRKETERYRLEWIRSQGQGQMPEVMSDGDSKSPVMRKTAYEDDVLSKPIWES